MRQTNTETETHKEREGGRVGGRERERLTQTETRTDSEVLQTDTLSWRNEREERINNLQWLRVFDLAAFLPYSFVHSFGCFLLLLIFLSI